MSCYIKSKDGIFHVGDLDDYYTDGVRDYPKEYALKVADSPIELCDGFYNEIEGGEFSPLRTSLTFARAKAQYDLFKANGDNIRLIGFIKTDRGLLFCLRYDDRDNNFVTLWNNIEFEEYNKWLKGFAERNNQNGN